MEIPNLITKIERFSTYDGYGIRSTVFVKGCPLRCKWCSNPETQKPYPEIFFTAEKCKECGECVRVCPEQVVSMNKEHKIDRSRCTLCMECVESCRYGALQTSGLEVTPNEIAKVVAKDMPFYKRSNWGVTISGGEPLLQPHFTSELFRLCHEKGIHTCLDTSGYGAQEHIEQVLKYVDLVLLDIKCMDPVKHKQWTGLSNELILKNAKLMVNQCEVRISLPLVPGVSDDEENIRRTAEFAVSIGVECIDVLPFHRLGESKYEYMGLANPYTDFEERPDESINKVLEIVASYGLKPTKERSM